MPEFTLLEHLRRPWSFDEPEIREQAAARITELESKLGEAVEARDMAEKCLEALQVKFGEQSGELTNALLRLDNIRTLMENMDLRDEHTMALLHALDGAKIVETDNSYSVVERQQE